MKIYHYGKTALHKPNRKRYIETARKTKKAGLQKKSSTDEKIKLSNKFEVLREEPCTIEIERDNCNKLFMIGKHNIFHLRKRKKILKKNYQKQMEFNIGENSVTKCGNDWLMQFETFNRFKILDGHQETNIASILEVSKLLIAPKRSIKKCKKCNLRRRACAIDPLSCKALQYLCSSCKKFGHVPKSMNCKGETRCKTNKASSGKISTSQPWSKQWRADVFLLLMKRINYLQEINHKKLARKIEISEKNKKNNKRLRMI